MPCSSVLSVGCLLLSLTRILTLCPSAAAEVFCYEAFQGWWVCIPWRVDHSLHWSLLCRSSSPIRSGCQSSLHSGQPFMTTHINEPDVVSSAVGLLNYTTLVESAGISVVNIWTGMMSFWCYCCLVIGRDETLGSASAMTFSFPFKYSIFTYCNSWRSRLWRCGELFSHRHSDEVTQVQIQHVGALFQWLCGALPSLSGFWMHRWPACHLGEEQLLAPFWCI